MVFYGTFCSSQLTITLMTITWMSTIKLNTNCINLVPRVLSYRSLRSKRGRRENLGTRLKLYMPGHLASNAWSVQENSQPESVLHCSHIMKENDARLAANQSARTIVAA